MAVIVGTNAGFVASAPVADPTGANTLMDTHAEANKDTSPLAANKITEIGWWCDGATEDANFEVGLYAHDAGNDKPAARLYVEAVNAKGTSSGWKTVSVDWDISANTVYWIAAQLDNTATATNTNRNSNGADRRSIKVSATALFDPWLSTVETGSAVAIYAAWTQEAIELIGSVSGVSNTSAALSVATPLSASSSAVSGATASLFVTTQLIGSVAAVSGTVASLVVATQLIGPVLSVSNVSTPPPISHNTTCCDNYCSIRCGGFSIGN